MGATLDPALRHGVGASEVAALFGLHPYLTPLGLYTRILGIGTGHETIAQRRGTRIEGYLAGEYAEREGLFPTASPHAARDGGPWLLDGETQRHPEHRLLIASPDRVVVRDGQPVRLVEIKTARSRAGWADPDETPDGVPDHYALQVQHQLLVGVDVGGRHFWPQEAHLVASVGHLDDFRVYTIQASPAVHRAILERVERFWAEHVEPRVPPAWDGSDAGSALLRAMYPEDRLPLEPAPPEAEPIMAELRRARADVEAAQAREATAKQIVEAIIGDRQGLAGRGWRVTWKRAKDSRSVDWEAVAKAACATPALIEQHTSVRPGTRRFLPRWDEEAT